MRSIRWILSILSFHVAIAVAAVAGQEGGGSYRILVTNDDGVEAPGLKALVLELAKEGEVSVAAPEVNCSGASQSTRIFQGPMVVTTHQIAGAVIAHGVSGSPADAAMFGIVELGKERPFDVVVSGINEGANVGIASHYSGTVGAAMEAAARGLPAVAVSADNRVHDYALAARFAQRFVHKLRETKPQVGIVFNINVPAEKATDIKGVLVTRMGGSHFSIGGFRKQTGADGKTTYGAVPRPANGLEDGTDTKAYLEGFITIAPLRFDWTDEDSIAPLKEWRLGTA